METQIKGLGMRRSPMGKELDIADMNVSSAEIRGWQGGEITEKINGVRSRESRLEDGG
jgi:hypothetical protein